MDISMQDTADNKKKDDRILNPYNRVKDYRPGGPGFAKMRILVVDDEDYALDAITAILKSFGVQDVVRASDGDEALEILTRTDTPFHLIITDIDMPNINGYQFARRIRLGSIPGVRDIPIIVLTGYFGSKLANSARATRINGFVTKPASADMLRIEIAKVFSGN